MRGGVLGSGLVELVSGGVRERVGNFMRFFWKEGCCGKMSVDRRVRSIWFGFGEAI